MRRRPGFRAWLRAGAACILFVLPALAPSGPPGLERRTGARASSLAGLTPGPTTAGTFAAAATSAQEVLERRFYRGGGRWNACVPAGCGTIGNDWGADSLFEALTFRRRFVADPNIDAIARAVAGSAPLYDTCRRGACTLWSDIPMWDAVAAVGAYAITGDPAALNKARHAFTVVDTSDAYALGACPSIDYQQPAGGTNALKTLETDSNYIRAALLLLHWTGDPTYLQRAQAKYAAVRRYFLDPDVPLYSVYVFDDGRACRQLPHRFFASVNGNMIAAGLELATATGERAYLDDALSTAIALARRLNDAGGVYADLQADNDVAPPLIEAMFTLATERHAAFARRWILSAATVAQPAPSGAYGRFFAGPPPAGPVSAWSASGGLILMFAAAALDPAGLRAVPNPWARGRFTAVATTTVPGTIAFHGRAIALIGTLGDRCCEAGHVRLVIDGRETFDRTGIWQNKSPASHRLESSILFSWRWPRSGDHVIAFRPGIPNAKEGGSYLHLTGYDVVP